MNYILFDDSAWDNLLPLTFTRPVAEIRIGILTIKEKWEKYLKESCSYLTKEHLQEKFKVKINDDNIFINGSLLPTAELISEIETLQVGQILKCGDKICAIRIDKSGAENFNIKTCCVSDSVETISECISIDKLGDIFTKNKEAIEVDFKLLTKGRKSQPLSKTNQVIGDGDIFLERGSVVECAVLNTKEGSIYIGKNAEVMENSAIRGPFSLGVGSKINMGAKVYGATTIGPYCKIGGEVNNVVIFGFTNKGHDGFLGNSVIGEWCNIGADTNSSNLKNNYAEVKLWSYVEERFVKTGLQFCGLIMGDHSKCGINTMFNTGTVVGVASNIFGHGFPRNFIPSFAWGGAHGFTECRINTAHEIAARVMERRSKDFDSIEQNIMNAVYALTAKYRESFAK